MVNANIKNNHFLLISLLLAIVGSILFHFIFAIHPNSCVPDNSLWDPSGLVHKYLLTMSYKHYNCLAIGTPFTSPLFYFFANLSIMLLLFLTLKTLIRKNLISVGFYRLIFLFLVIGFIYIFISVATWLLGLI